MDGSVQDSDEVFLRSCS